MATTANRQIAPLEPAHYDIDNRLPVWRACTEFYLDTPLDDCDYKRIAEICAASPYTLHQLDRIMFTEVWPAFRQNLASMAGEWRGWPDNFIVDRILKKSRLRFYIWWRLNPFKAWFCGDWETVKTQVKMIRSV